MALISRELKLRIGAHFEKGDVGVDFDFYKEITVTGEVGYHDVQTVGTAEESIVMPGDAAAPGYIILRNMDATNFIEIGVTSTVYNIKLEPARPVAVFPIDGTTLFAKADTGACVLEKVIIEQ